MVFLHYHWHSSKWQHARVLCPLYDVYLSMFLCVVAEFLPLSESFNGEECKRPQASAYKHYWSEFFFHASSLEIERHKSKTSSEIHIDAAWNFGKLFFSFCTCLFSMYKKKNFRTRINLFICHSFVRKHSFKPLLPGDYLRKQMHFVKGQEVLRNDLLSI